MTRPRLSVREQSVRQMFGSFYHLLSLESCPLPAYGRISILITLSIWVICNGCAWVYTTIAVRYMRPRASIMRIYEL